MPHYWCGGTGLGARWRPRGSDISLPPTLQPCFPDSSPVGCGGPPPKTHPGLISLQHIALFLSPASGLSMCYSDHSAHYSLSTTLPLFRSVGILLGAPPSVMPPILSFHSPLQHTTSGLQSSTHNFLDCGLCPVLRLPGLQSR